MFSYCKYQTAAPEAIGLRGPNSPGLSEPGLAGASLPKLSQPGWSEVTAGVQIHLSTFLDSFNRWARNSANFFVCVCVEDPPKTHLHLASVQSSTWLFQ